MSDKHPDQTLRVLTGEEVLDLGRRLREGTESPSVIERLLTVSSREVGATPTNRINATVLEYVRHLTSEDIRVSGGIRFAVSEKVDYLVAPEEFRRGQQRESNLKEIRKKLEALSDESLEAVARLVRDALEVQRLPRSDADNEGGEG